VLQDGYGLSPRQYGLLFAVNSLGLVAAAQASGRLVGRLGARTLLTGGAVAASAAGLASIIVVVAQLGLWSLLACFFVLVTCVGFVPPNAAALTLEGPVRTREPPPRCWDRPSSSSAAWSRRRRARRGRAHHPAAPGVAHRRALTMSARPFSGGYRRG
jgi:hypothetical protein